MNIDINLMFIKISKLQLHMKEYFPILKWGPRLSQKAIKNDIFLISPHSEVVGYFQNKANNYARWIGGMQKLRSRLKS